MEAPKIGDIVKVKYGDKYRIYIVLSDDALENKLNFTTQLCLIIFSTLVDRYKPGRVGIFSLRKDAIELIK